MVDAVTSRHFLLAGVGGWWFVFAISIEHTFLNMLHIRIYENLRPNNLLTRGPNGLHTKRDSLPIDMLLEAEARMCSVRANISQRDLNKLHIIKGISVHNLPVGAICLRACGRQTDSFTRVCRKGMGFFHRRCC